MGETVEAEAKVFTTDGRVAFAVNTKGEGLTLAEAEDRCKKANAQAKELGIETRYEVKGV